MQRQIIPKKPQSIVIINKKTDAYTHICQNNKFVQKNILKIIENKDILLYNILSAKTGEFSEKIHCAAGIN